MTMRAFLHAGALFALAAGASISACVPAAAAPADVPALSGPQVGQPAPDFTLTTLDGKRVHLSDYRGKTLVLNIWATWCPPCRRETPDLIAAYGRLHGAAVAFLGVDDTEQAPIVRAFVADKGVPYPIAIDRDQRFSHAYDVHYFPTTYVIDPHGIVRARNVDVITPRQLTAFVGAAERGENGTVSSPLQDRIDAALALSSFPPPAAGAREAARMAYARRVHAAIARAEDLLNQSDPAKGMTIDFLATRAMESALRARALAALAGSSAADPSTEALLEVMRGDQAAGTEAWSAAMTDYGRALRYSPSDLDALSGLEFAAYEAKDERTQIGAAARLASLESGSVDAQIDLGVTYQKYHRFAQAMAALRRANVLAMAAYRRAPADAARVRAVAATHLFLGRGYAAAGAPAQARAEFERLLAWARRLPPANSRHAMYIEEGAEAIAALDLSARGRSAAITLAPWTGPELPGSVPGSVKYRLLMTGRPNSTMALAVGPLPGGWIASFCTGTLCSPFRAQVAIPPSGVASIEFQVLRADAPRPGRATVRLDARDGAAHARAATTVDFTKRA
ncbi:MAG TPA: TlpA disulfide reductase family protein [Candidatus Dormibacteraeota bacterium]|nr:TlpA disulfide reductase family protein [Candidatus Dormibacteraeota bacterium]